MTSPSFCQRTRAQNNPQISLNRAVTRAQGAFVISEKDETVSSLAGRQTRCFYWNLICAWLNAFNHGCVPLSLLHRGIRRLQLYSYGCFSAHFIREFVFRVDERRWWGLHSLFAHLFYSARIMHINQHRLYFPFKVSIVTLPRMKLELAGQEATLDE